MKNQHIILFVRLMILFGIILCGLTFILPWGELYFSAIGGNAQFYNWGWHISSASFGNIPYETPDLWFGGDMHHNGYGSYRNITVINNGTWQGQTNFQVKLGHVPTPGIVPVLELKTGKITENYFYQKPQEE